MVNLTAPPTKSLLSPPPPIKSETSGSLAFSARPTVGQMLLGNSGGGPETSGSVAGGFSGSGNTIAVA